MDYAWGADIPGGVEARKQASPFLFAVHQVSKPGASAKHRRTATKGRVAAHVHSFLGVHCVGMSPIRLMSGDGGNELRLILTTNTQTAAASVN